MVQYLTKWSVSHFGGWVVRYNQTAAVRVRRVYVLYVPVQIWQLSKTERCQEYPWQQDVNLSTLNKVLMYPEGYLGYGDDTGVLVLLDDSTITPKNIWVRRGAYRRTAVAWYSCTYVCICTPGTWHISMSRWNNNTPDTCSCRLQLYIFGELAEVKNNEPQLEQRRNNGV